MSRRRIRLTRLDQRWWPDRGIRKRDVIEYYATIAPQLLPHLRDRPFTIKRHYNGPRSPFEWIKDAPPEMPDWIATTPQPAKSRGGAIVRYPLVQDEASLLWMVDFGCIDLHVWSSRKDLPARPDYVLFDLDPHRVDFAHVVEAAQLLNTALEALGLRAYVKTTGGDGLHVHVPIARRHSYEQVRKFCRVVALAVAASSDGLVTTARRPQDRVGVFIDTKMNGHGQQVVSAYSLRPLPAAAVAAPVTWDAGARSAGSDDGDGDRADADARRPARAGARGKTVFRARPFRATVMRAEGLLGCPSFSPRSRRRRSTRGRSLVKELHLPEEVAMSAGNGELDAQRRGAAKNQSLFREVNERIEDLARGTFTSFVCECLDDRCDERLVLTIEEYERVRSEPAWFFVLPGHEAPEVEDVAEGNDRYLIVRKLGVGERVAEKLNPRSRG